MLLKLACCGIDEPCSTVTILFAHMLVPSWRRSELLAQVHAHNRQLQEEAQQQRRPVGRRGGEALHVRDANVELITTMLAALEKEHEFL